MTFADLKAGDSVFLDANTLVYHFLELLGFLVSDLKTFITSSPRMCSRSASASVTPAASGAWASVWIGCKSPTGT